MKPVQAPTPRHLQVLQLLAQGLTKLEVSKELQISESTVKTHVARMQAMVGAHNVPHLVALGYQKGWLK